MTYDDWKTTDEIGDQLAADEEREAHEAAGDPWREPCWACLGDGERVICIDDLCRGAGECMHGDGMAPCDECGGSGYL